jgi:hypothetical protein
MRKIAIIAPALHPVLARTLRPVDQNGPSAWRVEADRARITEEQPLMEHRARIAGHQYHGGFMPAPANDNQAWPLLAQLRKDGNDVLIPVAQRYRRLWERSRVEPLQGTNPEADIFNIVQRLAAKNDPDGRTKGTLRTRHAAGIGAGGKTKRAPDPDKRADDDMPNPTRPGTARTRSWRGEDLVVSVIDAKRDIARLRAILGIGAEPFEEAVCLGSTLTEVGQSRGAGQSSPGAGKLVVMMGLQAVQEEFQRMDRERHADRHL